MRVVFILVFLLSVCIGEPTANEIYLGRTLQLNTPRKLDAAWKAVTSVNPHCPRFVYSDTGHEGLADQLERLFLALSLSVNYLDMKITVVVPDNFAAASSHTTLGYRNIMHGLLGLPHFLTMSSVNHTYRPIIQKIDQKGDLKEYFRRTKPLYTTSEFPCNTVLAINVYYSCKYWCPFFLSEDMHLVKPLLRHIHPRHSLCSNLPYFHKNVQSLEGPVMTFPVLPDQVNIVWHVRTGDMCLHCSDSSYFDQIYRFIAPAIVGPNASNPVKFKIIVVYMEGGGGKQNGTRSKGAEIDKLFKNIPNILKFPSPDLPSVVCTFLQADVVISLGSTFPSMVLWFSPQLKPVLLEDVRHWAIEVNASYLHTTMPRDAFHMQSGVFLHNTTDQLAKQLELNGVWNRINRIRS